MNWGRTRRIVKAASGIVLTKRVAITGTAIPDVSSVDYDNGLALDLLECAEAQDEEAISDGTAIADAPLYSRILGMRLNLTILGPSSSTVTYRWALYKMPDGENLLGTNLSNAANLWHSSADTPTVRELHKVVVAKGLFVTDASRGATPLRIFVKKSAWARIAPLREGDKLRLVIAKDATGTAGTIHGFGNLYVKANA